MERQTTRRLLLFLAAFLSGVLVAALGLVMAAAGHGWNAALLSATALLTIPSTAGAWILRGERTGQVLAGLVTVTHLAIDAGLVYFSLRGGTDDLAGALEHLAVPMVVWAGVWLGWQALAFLAALPRRRLSRQR